MSVGMPGVLQPKGREYERRQGGREGEGEYGTREGGREKVEWKRTHEREKRQGHSHPAFFSSPPPSPQLLRAVRPHHHLPLPELDGLVGAAAYEAGTVGERGERPDGAFVRILHVHLDGRKKEEEGE